MNADISPSTAKHHGPSTVPNAQSELDPLSKNRSPAVQQMGSTSALLNQDLCELASKLADLIESCHFYPALHYFHFSEPRYAMSRMLRFCLETASLLRAINDLKPDQSSVNSEASERLWHASLQMLEDAKKHFVICRVSRDGVDLSLARRFSDQVHSIVSEQSTLDPDASASAYSSSCHQWSNDLASLEQCTMMAQHCYH